MSEPTVYGFCDAKCKFPVYTQQQTMSILQQAIDAGSLQGIKPEDSPIVALSREQRGNTDLSLWLGTEAQFIAEVKDEAAGIVFARLGSDGTIYLCSDDTTFADWKEATAAECEARVQTLIDQMTNGVNTSVANKADKVNGATAGNFAALDANGNLVDSGYKYATFAKKKTATATLAVASWSSGAQTVTVSGVTASNTVFIAPAPASQEVYTAAGIICTTQAANKLTFTCAETPTAAVTVNVVIFD